MRTSLEPQCESKFCRSSQGLGVSNPHGHCLECMAPKTLVKTLRESLKRNERFFRTATFRHSPSHGPAPLGTHQDVHVIEPPHVMGKTDRFQAQVECQCFKNNGNYPNSQTLPPPHKKIDNSYIITFNLCIHGLVLRLKCQKAGQITNLTHQHSMNLVSRCDCWTDV